MAQDSSVPGLLSGVSMSTDTNSSPMPQVASLVVTYRCVTTTTTRLIVGWTCVNEDSSEDSLSPKTTDMMPPRSPEPVNLDIAVSAPDDPETGGVTFESDASFDSPE
uniref:Uncharacterized protein n=1 Tax=Peronospora matthiolae TaxID=2874970 RepID=A0AAV1T8G0_9STRA